MRGSQCEQEPVPERPPLRGPHSQGSDEALRVAADVPWSRLQVGRAKTHKHANKSAAVLEFDISGNKRGHTKDSHADLAVPRHYNKSRFSGHVHYTSTHLQILGPVLHPG